MIPGLGLVIVAAGSSNRMGGTDKVWAPLGGYSMVWHSLRALSPLAEHAVVVVHEKRMARAGQESRQTGLAPVLVSGGPRRQDSVVRGLSALPYSTMVAVHDAARPFARADLLLTGAELLHVCDGAIPGLPVTDTIKQVDERAVVSGTLDRASLRSIQTPQLFRRDCLETAYGSPHASGATVTDDARLLEACHFDVRVFPGQLDNFKITTEFDLKVARLLFDGGGTG